MQNFKPQERSNMKAFGKFGNSFSMKFLYKIKVVGKQQSKEYCSKNIIKGTIMQV